MTNLRREELLTPTSGVVRAVLDTDAFNEIDDQFAIAYALRSPERISLEAIYAAPFLNDRSTSPADGMEKSYEEIFRLLKLMEIQRDDFVFRGAGSFLDDEARPPVSPASRDLIARARRREDGPLYVLAIAAITNVAAALIEAPDIADNIVVVWLGGNSNFCPNEYEFNLRQDPESVRVVFDSGAPIVHVPCEPVASQLKSNICEMDSYLSGKGPLSEYLCGIFRGHREHDGAWTKVVWDIAVVAWLLHPEWVRTRLAPGPRLAADLRWDDGDPARPVVRTAIMMDRDKIFTELFGKLTEGY